MSRIRLTVTIPELEAFLFVAETGSFRVAAERAFVSQPALSRRVQAAEKKLNATLFDRDRHQVNLTAAGAELVPIAQKILTEFRDSLSDLSEFIAGRRGVISIWALPSVAAAILPEVTRKFQQSHPQVRLMIQAASAGQVAQAVTEGSADFGLSIELPGADGDLEFTPLLQDDFVLICSREDRLAKKSKLDWQILSQRPFITSSAESSIRQVTNKMLAHWAPEAYCVVDNIAVVGAMVAGGVGVAAVPRLALRLMDTSQLCSVELTEPAASRQIGILLRRRRSLSLAATHFIQALCEYSQGGLA